METTENPTHELPNIEPDIILTPEAQYYLRAAAKWASFLSIMGFIGAGFIALIAVFAGTFLGFISRFSPGGGNAALSAMGPVIGIFYFGIAAIMFFINLQLYKFSTNVKKGVTFIDSAAITQSTKKLKSFFKIKGIILIVVLSLYVLIIGIVIVAGIGAATMNR